MSKTNITSFINSVPRARARQVVIIFLLNSMFGLVISTLLGRTLVPLVANWFSGIDGPEGFFGFMSVTILLSGVFSLPILYGIFRLGDRFFNKYLDSNITERIIGAIIAPAILPVAIMYGGALLSYATLSTAFSSFTLVVPFISPYWTLGFGGGEIFIVLALVTVVVWEYALPKLWRFVLPRLRKAN